jgi:hypothetical protein
MIATKFALLFLFLLLESCATTADQERIANRIHHHSPNTHISVDNPQRVQHLRHQQGPPRHRANNQQEGFDPAKELQTRTENEREMSVADRTGAVSSINETAPVRATFSANSTDVTSSSHGEGKGSNRRHEVSTSNSMPMSVSSRVGEIYFNPDPRWDAKQAARRNIIAMLVRNTEKIVPSIKKQIGMMDGKYRDGLRSHFVILHDGFLLMKDIYEIRNNTKRMVEFINVDPFFVEIPKVRGFDPYERNPFSIKGGKWSYTQMIKFWFNDFFELSMLMDVDYYLRMDDDSVYLGPVNDIFTAMESRKGKS